MYAYQRLTYGYQGFREGPPPVCARFCSQLGALSQAETVAWHESANALFPDSTELPALQGMTMSSVWLLPYFKGHGQIG